MPGFYYAMAVDRLRDAGGRDLLEEALELELDLGEAEKCLWAARTEHLSIRGEMYRASRVAGCVARGASGTIQ